MATGCGCKEVYRFPHTTYISLLSCICSFFVHFLKCFFLIQYNTINILYIIYVDIYVHQNNNNVTNKKNTFNKNLITIQ